MHYPLTDMQADFEINRPVRYRKYREWKLFPQTSDGQTEGQTEGHTCADGHPDGRTDVAYDNNR